MKSGLEGRNNPQLLQQPQTRVHSLNEVRPRRPEQWSGVPPAGRHSKRLNEVRPRRPEQSRLEVTGTGFGLVSMKSGLEGRNNADLEVMATHPESVSQ